MIPTARLALSLAAFTLARLPPANALQTTITLYDVARGSTAPASQLFTPIGVGADGATTYRNEVYVSGSVVRAVTTFTSSGAVVTQTGPETTSTVFATLVADASHFVYSHIPPEPTNPVDAVAFPPQVLNCTLNNHTSSGTCVIEWWEQGGRFTETFTSTYTGRAIPLYTLTASVAQPTPTVVNSTSSLVPAPTGAENTSHVGDVVPEETGAPQENGAAARTWGHAWVWFGVGVGVLGTAVVY